VVPRLPGYGAVPRIYDTATRQLVEARPITAAGLYVCGITPYDATHIGHAATYLAYDTLIRLWLDAGYRVRYVQNTTDVDDPLLKRAAATGVDWRTLAAEQTELFRRDMERLRVIPPNHYIAATEMIGQVADAVRRLLDRGTAYRLADDIYFDKLPGNIDAVVVRENSHLQIARPERSVHRHWRLGADPIAAWVNVEIGVTDEWRSVHQGRSSQVRASAR
jgi:cysteinyl-tRNA synthetase